MQLIKSTNSFLQFIYLLVSVFAQAENENMPVTAADARVQNLEQVKKTFMLVLLLRINIQRPQRCFVLI